MTGLMASQMSTIGAYLNGAAAALIACPVISLLFPFRENAELRKAREEAAAREEHRPFRIIPADLPGMIGCFAGGLIRLNFD